MPGVAESAVIGVPHADFGEAVAAVVVARKDTSSIRCHRSRVEGELANYKVPKRLYVVDDLPRNAMGKVQKALLREKYAAAY